MGNCAIYRKCETEVIEVVENLTCQMQKEPFDRRLQRCSYSFAILTGKHPWILVTKFLRAGCYIEHLWWLLLKMSSNLDFHLSKAFNGRPMTTDRSLLKILCTWLTLVPKIFCWRVFLFLWGYVFIWDDSSERVTFTVFYEIFRNKFRIIAEILFPCIIRMVFVVFNFDDF